MNTTNIPDDPSFAPRLLAWFYAHGRHDLPWQQLGKDTPNPYEVWVSEIMLQQTQVAAVVGYYNKFIKRFANVQALADAPVEEVLSYWAGLGYYARARNLHHTAKVLAQQGYPDTVEGWAALRGVGVSTAGAIVAMGLGGFGVICDGNVKRVLTRYFAINDDINKRTTDKLLWQIATRLTPSNHSNHYAQAIMDLGATVCTKSRPACLVCPVGSTCLGKSNPQAYPVKTKKPPKPTRHSLVFVIKEQNRVFLVQRPYEGIWGGLFCLPMYHLDQPNPKKVQQWYDLHQDLCQTPIATLRHSLTHFHWQFSLYGLSPSSYEGLLGEWFEMDKLPAMPAAMHKLLGMAKANQSS